MDKESQDVSNVEQGNTQEEIALALQAERQQFEAHYKRQSALAKIELTINQNYELQSTLDHIAQVVTDLLPASGGASLILWDAVDESYYVSSSTVVGQSSHLVTERIRRKGGATRWIIDHGQSLIIPDVKEDPFTANQILSEFKLEAYVGMPLLVEGKPLGVLYALDLHPRPYTDEDIAFLSALANRAALVISQVGLYEDLQIANQQLRQESEEKSRLLAELQAAFDRIKLLEGLISICANCKKIRDDQGLWQKVESYIESNSDAKFSHGICPDCMITLYPEFFKDDG